MYRLITSESVNVGHPDKTCDIIADSILDEALSIDPNSQMAVECAIKNDLVMIYGEATTLAQIDYEKIAIKVLRKIGYKNAFRFVIEVSKQSPDIAHAVKKKKLRANDQGIIYGFATNETKEYMPLPILVASKLMRKYEQFRQQHNTCYFADAKSQVTIRYNNQNVDSVDNVVVSVSHSKELSHEQIVDDITKNVIDPVLNEINVKHDNTKLIINPSGKFTIWGSFCDSGCVGRKIVVDTYGGIGRVGGGCFSSKNATKVDRSSAYYARFVAKNIVAHKLADVCEIQISYAIGLPKPTSFNIECFKTNHVPYSKIYKYVKDNFDFSVGNIISELDLLKPIYAQTAINGHFGLDCYSWEKIKK